MGDGGGLGAVGDAELREDVRDVHARCLLVDEQRFRDLAVRATVGDEGKNLQLAAA